MLCYRDMTFCPFYEDCGIAAHCVRPLTPEVIDAADKYGLPTAEFSEKPGCHTDFRQDERQT